MGTFTVDVRDGIAWATLDLPGEPVNKITKAVREELAELLRTVREDDAVKAVVLRSGKAGTFIAGADIDEFVQLEGREEAYELVRRGQELLDELDALGKPVVAAIQGACLGGGLETALVCSYRIVADHPKTRLGLPEVRIGILPAAGGCQRLPRLIGLRPALDIILAGKDVSASRAKKLGLADELVHPAVLDRVAEQAARRLIEGWAPARGGLDLAELALDKNPLGRKVVMSQARKAVLKTTNGQYPAPLAALRAVEHGLRYGIEAGLDMEAALFADLATGDVSRRLVEIFFADRALEKDSGVEGEAPPPKRIHNVGIVGAGFMGASIGGVAVMKAGVDVRFRDTSLEQVGRGITVARGILRGRVKRRRLSIHECRQLERLLSGGVGWEGFGRADLVVEAVFESLDVKHQVFRELEEQVREDCVLASNTSTIPIHRIAAAVQRPERLLGMHFFSPVDRMQLLEVIVTDQTAPWVTVTAVDFGRRMGKKAVVVRDSPGFWVNRILSPYMNEAGHLLHEGVLVETIDRAMEKFGFPVGPVELLDSVGLDVAAKASEVMHEAFGERMQPMAGLARMIDDGRLGRKNGFGFYRYEHGKKQGVDETIYEIIDAAAASTVPREDVGKRLVFAMLNEAALAVAEQVVRSPRDGDLAAVFGIGFPPFRGGPLRYLDELGASRAVEILEMLQARHGDRFAPAPLLRQMAESGERFYPSD